MAGKAAAIITASRAEIKAVRHKVANANQNDVDLPDQMFALRGTSGVSGICSRDFSSSRSEEIVLGKLTLDMMIFGGYIERKIFIEELENCMMGFRGGCGYI
jgi:hypothetical protein